MQIRFTRCNLLLTVLLASVLSNLTAGCETPAPPPTVTSVAGRYTGRYAEGKESFDLKEDGTFTQEFRRDDKVLYTLRGKWKLLGNTVTFEPMMTQFSHGKEGAIERMDSASGILHQETIVFSEDNNYAVGK